MDFDICSAEEKVAVILQQKKEQELEEDSILKHIIKIIFINNGNFQYPKIKQHYMLLQNFVEIISFLFNMHKKKRGKYYKKRIEDIKDELVIKTINSFKKIQNVHFLSNEGTSTIIYKND